jgi:hypothetical protein
MSGPGSKTTLATTLRWPTLRELRVAVPLGIPLLVLFVFVVRGCSTASVPILHPPADASLPAAEATSAPQDLTAVQLAGAKGTTTLVPTRATGTAHLSGAVNGPQGPVPGANVRVEHLVPDHPAPIDVLSGPDGHWDLNGIAGGPYRVRAFMVPSLAQTQPQIFFMDDGEQRTLDLTLDAFNGVSATSAIAPDPPQLNQPANLVIRVSSKTVDPDGVVRAQPVVNATVSLTGTQGWFVRGPSSASTDANGDAVFTLECRSAGASNVQISVRPTPADAPQAVSVDVSACSDPNATTTTAASSGSGPPSSSSGPPPN